MSTSTEKIPSTPSPPKESESKELEKQPIQSETSSNVYYAQVVEKDYAWKEEQEKILKKWADKALCFKMMHEKSHKRYWCLNAWFNIPIIIISTITGTGNFASGNFITGSSYFIFALGALNLFGGILATIATYTGVAQKLEAHRFASIGWDKFARRIQIELAKSRKDRVKARDFIRQSAEEYDRLIEMSPILPNDIVRWFINLVKNNSEESMNECATCCHETFCFACGCGFCLNWCCPKPKEKKCPIDLSSEWNEIDVPEIIGRIKSTKIADVQVASNNITASNKFIAIKSSNENTSEKLFRSQSNGDLSKKQSVTFADSINSQSYRNSVTNLDYSSRINSVRLEPIRAETILQPIRSEPILEPPKAEPILQPIRSEPILEPLRPAPILEPPKAEPILEPVRPAPILESSRAEPILDLSKIDANKYYYPRHYTPYPEQYVFRPGNPSINRQYSDPSINRQYSDPYINKPYEKETLEYPSSTMVNPPLKNYNLEELNLTPRTITSIPSTIPPSPRLLNEIRIRNMLRDSPTLSIKSAEYPIKSQISTLNYSPAVSIKSAEYPIKSQVSTLNYSPAVSIKSAEYPIKKPTLIHTDSQSYSTSKSKRSLYSESPKSTISSISSPHHINKSSYDSIAKLTNEVDELLNDKVSNDKISNDNVSNDRVSNDKVSNDKVSNDKVSNDKISNDKVQNNQYIFEKECVRNISQLNSPLIKNNNEIEMTTMNTYNNFEEPTHVNINRYYSNSTIHISDTENDMDDDNSQITDNTI